MITWPTRGNNILDLLFVSDPNIVADISISESSISDHNLVVIESSYMLKELSCSHKNEQPPLAQYRFDKVDWPLFKKVLLEKSPLQAISNIQDPDEGIASLIKILEQSCELSAIPKKSSPGQRPKIPKDRRKLFHKRSLLIRKGKNSPSQARVKALTKKIIEIDSKIKDSVELDLLKQQNSAVLKIKTDPKYFFKYARKQNGNVCHIGPLSTGDGVVTDPSEIADVLSSHYSAVFSTPLASKRVTDPVAFFSMLENKCDSLSEVCPTLDDVKDALRSFRASSAPGPDGVPPIILKECMDELAPVLLKLLSLSLSSGKVPDSFKLSKIVPIFKGGSKKIAASYRPISLTSILAKVFEKVIKKYLISYLENNSLLNSYQHGFRRGRSTFSALIEHAQLILDMLEEGGVVDVVYLDFAKAFDKVDHGLLMHCLKKLNIQGSVGVWLHNFLSDRKQYVEVNGSKSNICPVISGVPQYCILYIVYCISIQAICYKTFIVRNNSNISQSDNKKRLSA